MIGAHWLRRLDAVGVTIASVTVYVVFAITLVPVCLVIFGWALLRGKVKWDRHR